MDDLDTSAASRPVASRPTVRLAPKADARAIRQGFPWIYRDQMVLDRRTKALTPGCIVTLESAERQPLATVTVNPGSKIVGRVLDPDPAAEIGPDWLERRLGEALAHRERLYSEPFYRLVHAEADGLPGTVVDRFGDVAVLQPNAAWAEARSAEIAAALASVTGVSTVISNGTGRARVLEGLPEETRMLMGAAPEAPVEVAMNGAVYLADLMGGQKTGLFFDQRDNHAAVARLAAGARVLDVFSHVGGFGHAALAAGAESCLAVDGSAAALSLAEAGAVRMGVAERFATHRGDAFSVLEALGGKGERYDLVVCDPPAFAPNRAALDKGLRAYERIARLAAPLVDEQGYLVLCSCSHAADLAAFRAACARGIGRARRRGRIVWTGYAGPDHPQLPQLAESGYLKALIFRL